MCLKVSLSAVVLAVLVAQVYAQEGVPVSTPTVASEKGVDASKTDAPAAAEIVEAVPPSVSGPEERAAAPVTRQIGSKAWHTDYTAAYREALREKKMLLLYFHDVAKTNVHVRFESDILASNDLARPLQSFVCCTLPVDAIGPSTDPDQPRLPLLKTGAFRYLYGRAGIAIVDLTDPDDRSLHGQVVSAHPFSSGLHYSTFGVRAVLGLPRGTITQRTLTYAVRMHPAGPQSAFGMCSPFLCQQATVGSQLMSNYGSVGHHDWGNRSAVISSATGRFPSEVAAMGGNVSLIDAANDIVNQWAGSPTHWGMVSAPSAQFGYDMVQGPGGGWYGTGLFVN